MSVFPVVCTAEVPPTVVEKFLSDALAGSNELVPNSEPALAIVTAVDVLPTTASEAPLEPFTSPFLNQSVEEVSRQLNEADLFAVLDERSTEDETAVLVERKSNGSIETVRVTFDSAQHVLVALDVATLGFTEIQQIAESSGGAYGWNRTKPKKGKPAPRKRLRR
ncbi:hypothetical protein F4677DRAFT_192890 [Hypoxylon crocopeplum]|nr:hypothetical protein F4677DRAFT_192890 [Hypoxylon crocopeplum]